MLRAEDRCGVGMRTGGGREAARGLIGKCACGACRLPGEGVGFTHRTPPNCRHEGRFGTSTRTLSRLHADPRTGPRNVPALIGLSDGGECGRQIGPSHTKHEGQVKGRCHVGQLFAGDPWVVSASPCKLVGDTSSDAYYKPTTRLLRSAYNSRSNATSVTTIHQERGVGCGVKRSTVDDLRSSLG